MVTMGHTYQIIDRSLLCNLDFKKKTLAFSPRQQ